MRNVTIKFIMLLILTAIASAMFAQSKSASYSAFNEKANIEQSSVQYDPAAHPTPRQGGEDIASAIVLTGPLPINTTGTTTGYVDDYHEICPYDVTGAPDVVYQYTPVGNVIVDIDLCGSAYDTKVYVYENSYTPGFPFACNDDFYTAFGDPCGQWVSKIEGAALTGGNTYYIVIDGYSSFDFGAYNLTISEYVAPPDCVWGVDVICPPGALTESEACGDDDNGGCNMAAGTETWEPVPATGGTICGTTWANGGNRDTDWYELVLTETSDIVLTADADQLIVYGLIDGGTAGYVGNPVCSTVTGILPNNTAGPCNETTLDLGTFGPGTYWFFVGMTVFDGFPCDVNYWIDFDITASVCPPPAALNANNVTQTTAELEWTPLGTETLWNIALGLPGFDPDIPGEWVMGENDTNKNPWLAEGLTSNTAYQFYVQAADCGAKDVSEWAGPFNFSTLCDVIIAPINEPFAITTIPDCWTMSGPQPWLFTTSWPAFGAGGLIDHTPGGGTSFAGVDGSGAAGLTGITLLSPFIDLTPLTAPRLRFYLFNNNTNTSNPADEQSLTVDFWDGTAWQPAVFFWDFGQNAAGWQEIIVDLSLYTISGPAQLRFVVDKGTGLPFYDDIIIDDVIVEEAPLSPIFSINPTEWDFGDVELGEQSLPKVFTISNAGPGVLTVSAPTLDNTVDYTLDFEAIDYPAALEGSETVTFSVVFHPSSAGEKFGEVSINYDDTEAIATVDLYGSGIVRPAGSTCGNPYPVTLPVVDFAGDTEPMGDDYSSTWINPTSSYLNGNDMVFQFTLDEPGYLSGGLTSLQTWIGLFILEDCPDPVNPAEVLVSATTTGSSTSFTDHLIDAGSYFAIVSSWPSPQTIEFTLNLSFEPLPDCPAPIDLTATNITATSALLGWTEIGSATSWNIEWGLDGFEQGVDGTLVPGVANPHLLEGLDPETDYEFYVQADCGEASRELSEWAGPFAFSTIESCPAPTALTTVSTTTDGAEVSWTSAAPEFEIEYGVAPYDFDGIANITDIMTNSYTFTGLDPATTYQYKVKAICGEEDESLWSAIGSFTTECDVFELPFEEDFAGLTLGQIPVCWSRTHNNWGVVNTANAGGTAPEMRLTWNPSFDAVSRLIAPAFNTDGETEFTLSLNQYLDDYTFDNEGEYIAIEYSTDGGSTWTELWQHICDVDYGPAFDEFNITLAGPATEILIAFKFDGNSFNINHWYIDDVSLTVVGLPTDITVSGPITGDDCFDATESITIENASVEDGVVADFRSGGTITATNFEVETGGTAYLTAVTSITLNEDVLLSPGATGLVLLKIDDFAPCALPLAMVAAEDVIVPEEIPAIPVQESFFKVFPNPTTSTFKLELLGADEAAKINVEIYGMMGERVFQDVLFGGSQYEFDLSNMPKGIYFIRVLMGDEMGIEKVIKQ